MRGFGQQGMAQSQQFAIPACTLFRVSIRVSYFVLIYLAYRLAMALDAWLPQGGTMVLYGLGSTLAEFCLLYLTVLVHEFGHGTMARCLGGEIDHILLWPFGGICFSTRPTEHDARLLVKNDFKVVAAGPATHIPQTALWVLVALAATSLLNATTCTGTRTRGMTHHDGLWWRDGPLYQGCFPCEGAGCIGVFLNPLSPQQSDAPSLRFGHLGLYFLYMVPITAINLNLMLFAFNVFFPMYPMDSAKLLTSSLMYFCRVRPYRAAGILIACSSTCAVALIAWAVYTFRQGLGEGMSGGGQGVTGLSAFSGVLPGLLGLMALQEALTIYNLRHENRLSEHAYFQAARTHFSQGRDEMGAIATLNRTGRDDRNFRPFGASTSGGMGCSSCCLCRCLCFPWAQRRADPGVELANPQTQGPLDPQEAQQRRDNRKQFLESVSRA